ncbi:hypothetical protein JCM16418A_11350 [Paenibacillus pini]
MYRRGLYESGETQIVRYALDSSKTSKRLEDLINEVHDLRTEIKIQNNEKQGDNKYIIDEKV